MAEEDQVIAALREELRKERIRADTLKVQLFEDYSGFQTRLDEEVAEHDVQHLQKIQQLEQRVAEMTQALNHSQTEHKQQQQLLSSRETATESLQRRLDVTVQELETSRSDAAALRTELGQSISQLRVDLEASQNQLHDTKQLLAQREDSAEALLKTADEAAARAKLAAQEREELRSELGQEISHARAQLADAKHLLSDREHAAEAQQQNLDGMVKQLDQARAETASVRTEMGDTLAVVRRELASVRDMLAQREVAQSGLERAADNNAAELKVARDEAERVRMELGSALEEERARASVTMDMWENKQQMYLELEAEYDAVKRNLDDTKQLLAQRDRNAEALLKTADEAAAQAKTAAHESEELRSTLGREISHARAQLADAKQLLADRETIAESQQRTLDNSAAELTAARQELDSLRTSFGQDVDQARNELVDAKQLLAVREHAAEALQQKLDDATRQLDQSRQETTSVRSELGDKLEQVRREVVAHKDLLAEREVAQSKTERALDESASECKQAREETQRVRMELGNALEEERERCAATTDLWEGAQQQFVELEGEKEALQQNLHEARQMLAQREANAEALLKTADQAALEAKLATQEREELRSELGREITNLRSQLADAKHLLSDRETIAETQERQLDSTKAELVVLHHELDAVRTSFGQEVDIARDRLAQSQQLLGDREHAAEAQQQKLDALVKQLDQSRAEAASVRTEMGDTLASVRRELASVRDMLAQREVAQSGLERAADNYVAELKLAREETQRVRMELGSALEEERGNSAFAAELLDARNKVADDLEAELVQVQQHLGETRQLLAQRDGSAEALLKTADHAAAQAKRTTQEREDLRSELGREINSLRSQLADAKHLLSDRETIAESQQRKLDSATQELVVLHQELDSQRTSFGQDIDSTRSLLAQLQHMLVDREHASEALQQKLDGTVKQLDQSRQETAAVRSEMGLALANLRSELGEVREMLAQRELAQEMSIRLVDESQEDRKLAREETQRVRAEMGLAVEQERAATDKLKTMLEARNVAGDDLQRQLDATVAEAKHARKDMDALRHAHGTALRELRTKLETEAKQQLAEHDAQHQQQLQAVHQQLQAANKPVAVVAKEELPPKPAMGKWVVAVTLGLVPALHFLETRARL